MCNLHPQDAVENVFNVDEALELTSAPARQDHQPKYIQSDCRTLMGHPVASQQPDPHENYTCHKFAIG